ncbi:hypothetical protein [Planococcus ruber]|uniref:hypothetical protein n=1 Tax=Planococcus ruber TaxID=2027871 RepID=UPI001FEEE8DD|nr:hypothetical protein [Planococcus ruber]MCJ1908682.1 hypothetical protein [Planococcus ruber]
MKYLKQQKGYALLVTLLILVVFSILGATLMMFTFNGGNKNEVREDITQSADLSQKGIDLMTTQINDDLTKYLGANGVPRTDFLFQLERVLDKYRCTATNSAATISTTGSYKVCIDSYVDSITEENEVNPLKKLVTFKSIGTSGKSNRELVSKIEIGAETAPEALRYAVGTNIDSSDGFQPGEGNLLMHGGVDITGDVKVDGNIVTSSNGYAQLGGDRWIPSLAPSAIPLPGTDSSRLFLGKKAYFFTHSPTYSSHIALTNFTSNGYSEKSNIDDLFRPGFAPDLVSREPVRSPIGITTQKANFEYSRTSAGAENLDAGSSKTINGINKPSSKVFLSYTFSERVCVDGWWWFCSKYDYVNYYDDSGTFTFKGTNKFKQVSTNGSATFLDTNSTFESGMYVNGNLLIGNNSTSENVSNYSAITLDGPIYVNGNVTIKGADLLSNVLLYVNGSVTIEYSRINGKSLSSGKRGSLIILSKGNIKISNNSVNQDAPSYIKGFFYTEQDFEMFGVGSNIKIDGGISARKIVLNAIRGRAKDTFFTGSYQIPNRADYFENVNGQQTRDSRLQVIYDSEIISTYSDLKQQEPVIYKVDPPLEKDRSY